MNSGRRTARQEEEFHVQRRNAALRKQEHWNSVAEYFKTWDVKASKYAAWTSPKYFQQSEEARIEAEKKEKKEKTLNERRSKLKQILDSEQTLFEEEMKKQSRSGRSSWMSLDELKNMTVELKRCSEEGRRREAELRLYQRWKQGQPTLRELERRQHLEFMKRSWIDQVKEREATREKQRVEEALRAKEEELKRKREEELEKMRQMRKEEELKNFKLQIKQQMDAIKDSVQRYKDLEKQEAEERKLQSEIEKMITQRRLTERKQANQQLVAYWTKQYQLKLQKKAKEVEEEILQDQKMLQRLKEEMNQEVMSKAQAKEIAKKEMEQALKALHAQRQREVLRQKEYENMFYEEAKRAWDAQERKWALERQARDILMREVLDTIKKQVDDKLKKNSEARAEALQTREQLLSSMNQLYLKCNEQEMQVKLAQDHYHKELDQQVVEKNAEKTIRALEEAEIEKKRAQADVEEQKRLAEETEKLKLYMSKYRPQDFRRQRVIW